MNLSMNLTVAILGATSQIAEDLIREWAKQSRPFILHLYARNYVATEYFMKGLNCGLSAHIFDIKAFGCLSSKYDVIINFVGIGDPSKALAMSTSIQNVTFYYDDLIVQYLKSNPECKYIFLSSGAVYGSDYSEPASLTKHATFDINNIQLSDNYGLAKFITEVKHRELKEYQICDLRVFNYFSQNQNMNARFFITDLFRSIKDNSLCLVNPEPMVRDYLHPEDFCQIIDCLLSAEKINKPFDCYSSSPIDKGSLLYALTQEFKLKWKYKADVEIVLATGSKCNYYSKNKTLSSIGYKPKYSSLETILREFKALMSHN